MKQKFLLPILFLLIPLLSIAEPHSNLSNFSENDYLEKLRLVYFSGVENEEFIDSLQSLITNEFGKDTSQFPAIALAYQAGVKALKSKHAFWPFSKMSYLNESMDLFAKAIDVAPRNLEIRFMRFSILYYVPGILGYDEEESQDAQVVYELLLDRNYSQIGYEIQEGMAEFILRTDHLTGDEKQTLKNRFALANNE